MKRITGDQIKKGLSRIKFDWVREVMRKELPPHIFDGMRNKDPNAVAWMKEQGYRIEQEGNVVTILKGFKVIGRKFMVLELKSWDEMDAIVNAIGHIIPPQKVDPDVR